jgi:hypothetical protein
MKILGKIIEIKETQPISESFKKRNFVVEYTENIQYPEYISFELVQDKCDLLDNFQIGQEVEVTFNLRGRKWVNPDGETKYFNSLQAWRIEPASGRTSSGQTTQAPGPVAEDDLPF